MFVDWAGVSGAEELRFPTFISAGILQKLDYFHSFPQLATFPVALDPEESNLKRFSGGAVKEDGTVGLTEIAPVRDVLTPAACFHVYPRFQETRLDGSRTFTTLATCFRPATRPSCTSN